MHTVHLAFGIPPQLPTVMNWPLTFNCLPKEAMTAIHQIIAWTIVIIIHLINPLTRNDDYSGRTAPLTSKRCILYI